MNPGARYCMWLLYLRSSFCSPQESITPLHKGQLRGQEGKSAKKAQGRRRIKIKKKSQKEVQHPVLNHGCFLMKPTLLLSNQCHLWSPQSPARKKKSIIANNDWWWREALSWIQSHGKYKTCFFWQTGKILWLVVQQPKAADLFVQNEHVKDPNKRDQLGLLRFYLWNFQLLSAWTSVRNHMEKKKNKPQRRKIY